MIIGLCGKARSGKDTIAKYLRDRYGLVHSSFADKLKSIISDLFDMSDNQVNGDLKETTDCRYGKSPRWLLQHVGTEVFRDLYPTVWSDYLFRHLGKGDSVVISDVRFQNELDAIRERKDGYVWKIERVGHEGARSGIENHASEIGLDHLSSNAYDAVLSAGDGDISLLLRQADVAFQKAFDKEGIL